MKQEQPTGIIPLKPTPARKRAIMANHAIPGILLLINGVASLGDESAHSNLAYLNILTGIAVILVLILELKQKNEASHRLVNKFEVIAGLVLLVEGVNHWHAGKIFQPALFYCLIGLFTVAQGILHSRFPVVRRLLITEKGFDLRVTPFRRLQLPWDEVSTVDLHGTILSLKTRAGIIHTLNLNRVENKEEVLEGLRGGKR